MLFILFVKLPFEIWFLLPARSMWDSVFRSGKFNYEVFEKLQYWKPHAAIVYLHMHRNLMWKKLHWCHGMKNTNGPNSAKMTIFHINTFLWNFLVKVIALSPLIHSASFLVLSFCFCFCFNLTMNEFLCSMIVNASWILGKYMRMYQERTEQSRTWNEDPLSIVVKNEYRLEQQYNSTLCFEFKWSLRYNALTLNVVERTEWSENAFVSFLVSEEKSSLLIFIAVENKHNENMRHKPWIFGEIKLIWKEEKDFSRLRR